MAMVAINVNVSAANSITSSARAVVIAPVNVRNTVLTYSTSVLVGITANLTIRIPEAGSSTRDSDNLDPASLTSSTVESNDCPQNGGTPVSCMSHVDEDGMLKGDPVSSILLNAADDTQPARNHVGITVTYN